MLNKFQSPIYKHSTAIKMKKYIYLLLFLFISGTSSSAQRIEKSQRRQSSPRIVEVEFLIDITRWEDYKRKYGPNPMPNISSEIHQLLDDASRHLEKLDKGGYKLHLHKPLEKLENSEFTLGSTYKDRYDNNKTKKWYIDDIVGYALTFQDAITEMLSQGWKTKHNIVRFILASALQDCPLGVWCPIPGAWPRAVSEELCLCNPDTFPCIGIFTEAYDQPDIPPESVMLANLIGRALGAWPDDQEPGYIMGNPILAKTEYEWSPESRARINENNLSCLERLEPRAGRYFI